MNPAESITPPEAAPPAARVSFDGLRETALAGIRRWAGDTWTDHNAHDPGITILEQLCYTLTDLAYRIEFDIRDLLASAEGGDAGASLFTPAEILTCNPVTSIDRRKVVIDVPGVKNAWIEAIEQPEPLLFHDPSDDTLYLGALSHRNPVLLQGVYRVLIATEGTVPEPDVAREVAVRLHACRSLGEDAEEPVILGRQGIVVQAEIEVGEVDNPESVLAEIYDAIANHISPRIRFHTLSEMLLRGGSIDEIFEGPALDHGFLDAEELADFDRKPGLRTSDVIQVIMGVKGVRAVYDIQLSDGVREEEWYLTLDATRTPVLDIARSVSNRAIRLRRGRLTWDPDAAVVTKRFAERQSASAPRRLARSERDRIWVAGTRRAIAQYHSFQHHLPRVYGLSLVGLEPGATPERRAKVRQLRGYLMFFDQILANSFSQVATASRFLSVDAGPVSTYSSQLPGGIPDSAELLGDLDAGRLQEMTEDSAMALSRRDRALNHLLARYAEEFGDFARVRDMRARIEAKATYLREYSDLSAGRGRAFDYSRPSWNLENISGLERRVARRLGVRDVRRRHLAVLLKEDEGGFHLLEHILLRPRKEDLDQWQEGEDRQWRTESFLAGVAGPDPYSLWLTAVFPDWIDRLGEREFIEKVVRDETPAHLRIRVVWLGVPEMAAFESAFRDWLDSRVAEA